MPSMRTLLLIQHTSTPLMRTLLPYTTPTTAETRLRWKPAAETRLRWKPAKKTNTHPTLATDQRYRDPGRHVHM